MFKLAHFRFYVNFSRLMGGCLFLLIFSPLQAFSRRTPITYQNFYEKSQQNKQLLSNLRGKDENSCRNVRGTPHFIIVFFEPQGSKPEVIFPVALQAPEQCRTISRDMVGSLRECEFTYYSSDETLSFNSNASKTRIFGIKAITPTPFTWSSWKALTWIKPSTREKFNLSTYQEPFIQESSTKSPCAVGIDLGIVARIKPKR